MGGIDRREGVQVGGEREGNFEPCGVECQVERQSPLGLRWKAGVQLLPQEVRL